MPRNRSTDINGRPFAQTTVESVWTKGRAIYGYGSNAWRRDICRKPMKFSDYGLPSSAHGWEIDHVKPLALVARTIFRTFNRSNGMTTA